MTVRKLRAEEAGDAVRILEQGRELLRRRGIPQWQKGGYPGMAELRRDLQNGAAYVAERDGIIIATFAFSTEPDISYRELISGEWLTQGTPYATVHRLAVSETERGKGVAGLIYEAAAELARACGAVSIRVDTHPKNLSMQRAMVKSGFTYCGELILAESAEAGEIRLGYERIL